MNTLYDQFQRCILHPHQRIVGICSSCLQERLISLIEPPSPSAQIRTGYDGDEPAPSLCISSKPCISSENEYATLKSMYMRNSNRHGSVIDGVAEIGLCSNGDAHMQELATVGTATGSTSTMETRMHADTVNQPISTIDGRQSQQIPNRRHRHHPSCDFAGSSSSVEQNGGTGKQNKLGLALLHLAEDKRYRGGDALDRRSRVSLSEGEKKKGSSSWFSLSKSRSTAHVGEAMQADERSNSLRHALKSPQHSVASTRRNSETYRHVHIPDLQAISEIDRKDVRSPRSVSREASTLSTGMSASSWILTFFSRKKSSRSRSNLSNSSSSSIQNAISDANGNDINANESSNRPISIEAGRLSWDGARPNFKQLLRKIETRGKKPSQTDLSSPLQNMDYTRKEYHDKSREATNHAAILQKSKSVASARSSICVEIPKDLMQSSFSPTIHQGKSNVMVGLEYDTFYDDQDLRRSRSWGRTWNRALSPLWGSRSHRHKATANGSSSLHQRDYRHACTPVTPSHVHVRNAATSASSSHLSPLRRAKLAPTLKNLL